MRLFTALLAGLLFGVGLGISGMTKPDKVLGFLDVGGRWDPSLAFVMVGAIAVHFVAQRIAKKRTRPFYAAIFRWPELTEIDAPLVIGSAVFGVGWGLGGFCPGPAITSAAAGNHAALVFMAAMAAGMVIRHATARARS